MAISPSNSIEVPRELTLLTELFPSIYSTLYDENTESCLESELSSKSLQAFYTQVLRQSNDQALLTLGQIGLGANLPTLLLWQVLKQYRQTRPALRVQLVIFEDNAINSAELKLLWQALGVLSEENALAPLANQFLQGQVAKIAGAQRFIFEEGHLCVDIHFGNIKTSLKDIPRPINAVEHWHYLPERQGDHSQLTALLWQMGRLSQDSAMIYLDSIQAQHSADAAKQLNTQEIITKAAQTGFRPYPHGHSTSEAHSVIAANKTNDIPLQPIDAIALAERQALGQQEARHAAHSPQPQPLQSTELNSIAIIGGGIAAACLALSLAERGQAVTLYCQDEKIADGASGNRQGALYPLLTPENSHLSQFFQQAFLFSRRRLLSLIADGYQVSHQLCGVLQTGFDERSDARLDKIIQGQNWPVEIALSVSPEQASELAGVTIDKTAFYYPLGGWISPHEFANACLEKAKTLAKITVKLATGIESISAISGQADGQDSGQDKQQWALHSKGAIIASHKQLVLACGANVTQFEQTSQLQMSGFRGQVSHVPAKGDLNQLSTVICANGYLTPSMEQQHCVGASYVKDPSHLDFCPTEQMENGLKMQHSFPRQQWPLDIDVSDMNARVGVRMVTRDHFPMVGCVPDVDSIMARYQALNQSEQARQNSFAKACQQYWQHTPAPVHPNLYLLAGLGSRGLSSGPLAAECLAAQLCGDLAPISAPTLALLNPNRMWMRKLINGKSLT